MIERAPDRHSATSAPSDASPSGESSPGSVVAGPPTPPMSVTAPQQVLPPMLDTPPPETGADEAGAGEPDPSLRELRGALRRQWAVLLAHGREPSPPPTTGGAVDELIWGLAQPLLGLRLLLRHGDLFVRGLVPALAFLGVCALVVEPAEGPLELLAGYYGVLTGAVSISPILFCRNYAKLAAEARRHLDLPRHEPYLRSYPAAIVEAIAQAIVLGVGVAPWAGLIGTLPLFGAIWAALIGWVWVLHWIVVEALDSARTLPLGTSAETLELRHAQLDPPWYAGTSLAKLRAPLPALLLPLRLWGALLARLGRRWRGEIALIELRPALAVGFGLGASVLLLIPGLNLLLRPALVIGASHVLGRLEPALPERPPSGPESGDDDAALGPASEPLALPPAG